MRVLCVGDPHATPDELPDCEALCELVMDVVQSRLPDSIVFMGDLHHTHAMVRVEVTAFWLRWLERFGAVRPTYVLLGNHDYPHGAHRGLGFDPPEAHALQPYFHLRGVTVVDRPLVTECGLMLPYLQDPEVIVKCVEEARRGDTYIPAGDVVYCHQDFLGARYENGFAPPGAFDPARCPGTRFISGHIHLPQEVGDQVQFVGAPRWRTLSDAGVDRYVWVFDERGSVVDRIPTERACSRIEHLVVTSEPRPALYPPRTRLRVDLHGTAAENERWALAFPGARVRRFDKDQAAPRVRESRGVHQAFADWLEASRLDTPPDRLAELALEVLRA